MSGWSVTQMARRRPDGEIVPEEGDLAQLGGPLPPAGSKPRQVRPAPTAAPASGYQQAPSDRVANRAMGIVDAPSITTQVAPFRAMMGDQSAHPPKPTAPAAAAPVNLPGQQIGPPAPNMPAGPTYEGVRQSLRNNRATFNAQIASGHALDRTPAQIAELRSLNQERDRFQDALRASPQHRTSEQYLDDAQNAGALMAKGARQRVESFDGRKLNGPEMLEREQAENRLKQLTMGPPAPREAFAADAQRRQSGAEHDIAMRESGRLPSGEQLTVGNLPVEGARARATRELTNSMEHERYLMARAREMEGQNNQLQDATATSDLAEQKARGAAASFASNPEILNGREMLEREMMQTRLAAAKGETALTQAKTRQIERGTDPEIVSGQMESQNAALMAAGADPAAISAAFARIAPGIRRAVGNGGLIDKLLFLTPQGKVSAALEDTPSQTLGGDPVSPGVDELLRVTEPLEVADQKAPGSAAVIARQLLSLMPPTTATGDYQAAYNPINPLSADARGTAAARLNMLRRRLTRLAGSR